MEYKKVSWVRFLLDVFIVSLGAFGGPEAHYGVIQDQMVDKRKYINEEELLEFIALTGILPGPSSTQTIIAIGYKMGGPLLGFLTFLVWALPAIIIMTILSFLGDFLKENNINTRVMRFVSPMAVAVIIMAAYKIIGKMKKESYSYPLIILGALISYFYREPLIFPLLLLSGGLVSILASNEKTLWNKVKINPPWIYLILFFIFALGSQGLWLVSKDILFHLFASFYKFGYMVIGGGQVVVPYMTGELVDKYNYLSLEEFLTGFGLVQGMPGPMFSFASYAGGMAARGHGTFIQIMGALLSGIGIFLPGIFLIYFVVPEWEKIKKIKAIKISLKGITAVAAGLIVASAFNLAIKSGLSLENVLVIIGTLGLLKLKKIPVPVIVALMVILGFIFK